MVCKCTDPETYYYTTRSLHARYTLAKRFTRNAERFTRNAARFARNAKRFTRNAERFTRNDSRTKRFARFSHALDTLLS